MNQRASEKYHVVVVGGGITGLSTAVAYGLNADIARRPILVLEKEPKVGGSVTSFRREGYLFDTVQMVTDVNRVLEYFDVDLPLKRFEGYCARIFVADPDTMTAERFDIPSGVGPFKAMLAERFPHAAEATARMIDYSEALFNEFGHFRRKRSLSGTLYMLLRCRRAVANSNLTFEKYLENFGITDPAVREIFDVFAAFGSLPTERIAAVGIIGAMITALRGSYRPTQGFIKFPHMLRRRAEELGVTIQCKSRVDKILVAHGVAEGVKLESGEVILADHVVTAVDTKAAMLDLVGESVLRDADPAYADKVRRVRMSPSSMTVSLGLDDRIDLGEYGMDCGYNVITTGKGTFEKLFKAFDRGQTGYSDACFHAAAIAPCLTTGGKPTLIIRVMPLPMADWCSLRRDNPTEYRARKQQTADFFINQVERYLIPGLRSHINVMDIASPATFERYLGTPTGSAYDMSPYPDNIGRNRLAMKTPIKGLLLPKFTHSIYGALQSGIQAADEILGGAVSGGRLTL